MYQSNKVYHKILQIIGNVIVVNAKGVSYNELAEVTSKHGSSLAQVIKLKDDKVYLQVFSGCRGISTGDEVRFFGKQMEIPTSINMIGRIFNGVCKPRDSRPSIKENLKPISGSSVNPINRIIPRRMVRTGIPMIDVFNTLVVSQKIPIFSIAGEPYNQLLARIASQAKVDIVILGGMGLKYDDYLYFKNTFEDNGIMTKSIMFIHTASEPAVECLFVPDISLAIAENYAVQGKDVLVLLTDMTNFADALKEIAISMEQVPSNRGYPGDLYSQLAARYEKAVEFEGEGSITILSVTTMPGDDVTHPVPDNTGYITEGQFYLKNNVIDPFGSLSRLKQQVNSKTRKDHRTIMDVMTRFYAEYKSTCEKKSMGFRMNNWDKKLLKYGVIFEKKLMDLSVNIPLEDALDLCWNILSECFDKVETGIRSDLVNEFWNENN